MNGEKRTFDLINIFLILLIIVLPLSIFAKYDNFVLHWSGFQRTVFIILNIVICLSLTIQSEFLVKVRKIRSKDNLKQVNGKGLNWIQIILVLFGVMCYSLYLIGIDQVAISNYFIMFVLTMSYNTYKVYLGDEYIILLGKIIRKSDIEFCQIKENKLYIRMKNNKLIECLYNNTLKEKIFSNINSYLYSHKMSSEML